MKIKLFFTNFRKKPNLFRRLKDNISTQLAIKKANILKQIYENIIRIKKNLQIIKTKRENGTLAKREE